MTQTDTLNDTLDFGLFDWIEWDKSAPNEIFENRLKMLELADRSGFYSYHLAEHHLTPLSVSPSPSVFLAAAAQRTSKLRLGPLVYLLPFLQPHPPVPRVLHAGQPQQRAAGPRRGPGSLARGGGEVRH